MSFFVQLIEFNPLGICKSARSCPKVREEYKLGVPLTICAYLSGQPVVCCPQPGATQNPSWNIAPSSDDSPSSNTKRISVQSN